jgi:hypothetical protein
MSKQIWQAILRPIVAYAIVIRINRCSALTPKLPKAKHECYNITVGPSFFTQKGLISPFFSSAHHWVHWTGQGLGCLLTLRFWWDSQLKDRHLLGLRPIDWHWALW